MQKESFRKSIKIKNDCETLNTRKGVIRCRELKSCTNAEILEGLSSQKVKEAYQIQIKRDGKKVSTGTVILTFDSTILPREVKVGYLNVPVSVYIPNPVRCFNCQKFGHQSGYCKNAGFVCAKCGQEGHEDDNCDAEEPQCANCGGNHAAYWKECPKWLEEKEIQRLKCTLDITFREARNIVEKKKAPVTQTILYSDAVAKKPSTTSVSTQTDLTWVNCTDIHPRKVPAGDTNKTEAKKKQEKKTQSTQSQRPAETPKNTKAKAKQKIIVTREQKGSRDPVMQASRFASLDVEVGGKEDEEEEDMLVETSVNVIPPTPATLPSMKGPARSPVKPP